MQTQQKLVTLTDQAARRIRTLLGAKDWSIGLRIGVKARGCSGLTYHLEYAKERGSTDEVIEDKGVTILIEPSAAMFLAGAEIDYINSGLDAKFVFNNPNETGRCGCGKSFQASSSNKERY
jgi:iron-sulfur cluster assembly protein